MLSLTFSIIKNTHEIKATNGTNVNTYLCVSMENENTCRLVSVAELRLKDVKERQRHKHDEYPRENRAKMRDLAGKWSAFYAFTSTKSPTKSPSTSIIAT